jgi:uncharacterized protein with HEPN domain
MLDALARIASYTQGMAAADFLNDNKTQDAVIRNLEIIGEACSNVRRVAPEWVAAHTELPWGGAIGNRNALAHGYFSVDMQLVWNTVQQDLPKFEFSIRAMLDELSQT